MRERRHHYGENFQVRRSEGIARDDALGALTPGKTGVQRIQMPPPIARRWAANCVS